MRGVKWDGDLFPFIEPTKWTIGEARALERYVGNTLSKMTDMERALCAVFITIKRGRPSFTWPQADGLPMEVLMQLSTELGDDETSQDTQPEPEAPGAVLSPTNDVNGV